MNNFKDAKRIVVKVGTSTLTHETGKLNLNRMEHIARVLSDFKNSGKEIILVTSAAITAGIARMGITHRPESTEEKQALAAIGQCEIMRMYERFFDMYGYPVAQVLVSKEIIDHEQMKKNAINTFKKLLEIGCIPIVNENDVVSFGEIEFGDNDTLSAYVAALCDADTLVILSDIDGLYEGDPRKNPNAKLIPVVEEIDKKIMSYAGGAGTNRGTGGVVTKLHAAQIAMENNIPMYILNGEDPSILYELLEGKNKGTYFSPKSKNDR